MNGFDWLKFDITSLGIPSHIRGFMSTITLLDIVDILLVAVIIYKTYEMLEDTRAITLVKGLAVLLLTTLLCNLLNLHGIYWLLQKTMAVLLVALPIVFQPELRRTLVHLGQGGLFGRSAYLDEEDTRYLVNEMEQAVFKLSKTTTGALIVLEREMGLRDICATGTQLDGLVTSGLLQNIFVKNTPLHDGAVVIRGNRVVAACCLLPLTTNNDLPQSLGTRHRAAIGLSEQCDAIIIVVSEETGGVSIAEGGSIERYLTVERFRERLRPLFKQKSASIGILEMIKNWRKSKWENG